VGFSAIVRGNNGSVLQRNAVVTARETRKMKRSSFGILAVILSSMCAVVLPAAAQQDEATARAQVLALEKLWNQAYKTGDVKALSALFDNSLVLVEDDGSLKTKSEFLASVKAANANAEQVAPESLTVRVFGNTAIAIGVLASKGTKGGKSVVHRERFIDTWLDKGGSWICIATDATPITQGGP
jgi:ketosteroid isomerase-like protein